MATRKTQKNFKDVTVEFNYSQMVRDQVSFLKSYDTGWDEERIARAAHFCKVFHNHSLDPDEIRRLLKHFEETVGFGLDY
tara:strand:+ start:306 stop:545 length:240 start_codon:yes stop_codon:yes gene_type:complete